ncbi:DUF2062 domain-containing protein [Aureibacter tunicatorum]|uniref:Uncharacterized protein (DUF2062 family) n=1 Tax=Aureibacter tunicatorum TaxID=866807 RepID=A0AAE3XJ44_9BACT|nr:DUF2062 domain-containing protein [Aureibacter tunicatorum]MDR6237678.1 uncharacterized protein (DUF2062 family) [Aureibacter tunicatorum]BDD02713.1 hypothetical protein AUTU_01960 [Aureibacter tunicatorum]
MFRKLYQKNVVAPLKGVLKKGASPHQMALSLTLGAIIGLSPLIGLTTIVCSLLCLLLGLNIISANVSNFLVYPIQLIVFMPFMYWGGKIMGVDLEGIDADLLASMILSDTMTFLRSFGKAFVGALLIWLVASIPFALICYLTMKYLMLKVGKKLAI